MANKPKRKGNGEGTIFYDKSRKRWRCQISYQKYSGEIARKSLSASTKTELIKTASFDLNKLYEDTLIGQGKYTTPTVNTLKNLSGYSVANIKSYASKNKLKLKFIDYSTNKEVSLDSWGDYKFHSQKEHKDTILNQLSTLTIYVKKKAVVSTPTVKQDDDKKDDTTNTENKDDKKTEEASQ